MKPFHPACHVTFFVLLMLFATPAPAVIRVDVPLDTIYKSASEILISKVHSVDSGQARIRFDETVTVEELGKKVLLPRDRTLTLEVGAKTSLAKQLQQGMPAVIFVGRRGAAVHIADAWYKASRGDNTDWRIDEAYAIARTFPGTTASLIRALLRIRAGEAPLVDAVMHHTWHGNFKLQTLDVTGKAMASADADGDGKADLAVVTDQGVRFYRGSGARQSFVEATGPWGLSAATARQIAFTDANGDRKPDLLLDALYLNDGSRFVRSEAVADLRAQNVRAVALMNMTGDDRPEALLLDADGTVTVFRNPGRDTAWPTLLRRRLWDDGDPPLAAHFGDWGESKTPHLMVIRKSGLTRYSLAGEAADLERLTGENPMLNDEARYFPMNDYLASAAWDRSGGDGNLDLHVVTSRGKPKDLELVGRGHGAFFLNREAGTWILIEEPGRGPRRYQPRAIAMTAADMYGDGSSEMLILEKNGTLWQKDSPVYVRGRPIGEWDQR